MAGLDFDIEAYMEKWRRDQEIHCPHCGEQYDFTSEDMGMVTYWGEDGPQELECGSCCKTFYAEENVYRTFKVGKTEKPMSPEERALVDSVLHHDGRCTCAGEGRCEWCRTHCIHCGRRVEHAREYPAYQHPTCYECLSPPEPLPMAEVKRRGE